MQEFEGKRRLVSDAKERFAALRTAAEEYPDRVPAGQFTWVRRKPFEQSKGNPSFFGWMYGALNMIKALDLAPTSTIVEVGSGPGWLTEILVGLGHRVHAIEPSPGMIAEARLRMEAFEAKTGIAAVESVTYSACTIEELDIAPWAMLADVVLFHEALHHVIDEHVALRRSIELLREGGCIAICGEGRWLPDDAHQAGGLYEEMERYGTLESPFTPEYLRHVLATVGFDQIEFFHAVNGLFPVRDETRTIREIATLSASVANTVIARRPLTGPQIIDPKSRTSAVISVLRVVHTPSVTEMTVHLVNTGETVWPCKTGLRGHVTLALVERSSSLPAIREAANRHPITRNVRPGEILAMECKFDTPGLTPPFDLDLIAEFCFWFSARTEVP